MSDDSKPITVGHEPDKSATSRAITLAQRAGFRFANEALDALNKQAGEHLLPRLEAAIEWMTSPDNVEQVQSLMARTAQVAIDMGFKVDHHAALLFEFVDWMEQEHSREEVAKIVWQYNSLADGTLLALLEARVGMVGQQDRGHGYARQLEDVRLDFLEMICALASLEDETPLPRIRRPETLRAYFERCVLPEKFYILAALGTGDPEAFAAMAERHQAQQEEEKKSRGLSRRIFDRVKRAAGGDLFELDPEDHADAEADTTQDSPTRVRKRDRARALVKLNPFDRDPSFRFLVNSYLFFLQTYTTRVLIERFPDAIKAAREMDEQLKEQQATASSEEHPEHVIDIEGT